MHGLPQHQLLDRVVQACWTLKKFDADYSFSTRMVETFARGAFYAAALGSSLPARFIKLTHYHVSCPRARRLLSFGSMASSLSSLMHLRARLS